MQLPGNGPEHKIEQRSSALHKCHKLRLKGMHQDQLGPHFSDKPLDQDPNRLEEHHKTLDQRDTATEGRDVPEPGRPA